MNRKILLAGSVAAFLAIFIAVACYAPVLQPQPIEGELDARVAGPVEFRQVRVLSDLTVDGDATVGDDFTITDDLAVTGAATVGETLGVTGAADFASTLQYGTGNLYPVGNSTSGKIFEFGITDAITETSITPVAITTVEAYGCQVADPAVAAAWYCGVSLNGTTLTMTTYEIDATPVATPASPVTYWIAGQ